MLRAASLRLLQGPSRVGWPGNVTRRLTHANCSQHVPIRGNMNTEPPLQRLLTRKFSASSLVVKASARKPFSPMVAVPGVTLATALGSFFYSSTRAAAAKPLSPLPAQPASSGKKFSLPTPPQGVYYQAPLVMRITAALLRILHQVLEVAVLYNYRNETIALPLAILACMCIRMVTYMRGQDPGKAMVSLFIVDGAGKRVAWWQAALRDIARAVVPVLSVLAIVGDTVLIFRDEKNRHGLTDRLFGTSVAVGFSPPPMP